MPALIETATPFAEVSTRPDLSTKRACGTGDKRPTGRVMAGSSVGHHQPVTVGIPDSPIIIGAGSTLVALGSPPPPRFRHGHRHRLGDPVRHIDGALEIDTASGVLSGGGTATSNR
jgi:hypothetical protein